MMVTDKLASYGVAHRRLIPSVEHRRSKYLMRTLHIPTGLPVLITRRVATDTDRRSIAMEETRRSAEYTQLSYPQTPTTE